MRSLFLGTMPVALLLCSCASSPARSTAATPSTNPVPVAEAVSSAAPDVAPHPTADELPALGRGECRDGFDCVDTVGFPPAGHRWVCEKGKCGRALLPTLGGDVVKADPASTTAEAEPRAASKRSRIGRKR